MEDRRTLALSTVLGILLALFIVLGIWTAHISHQNCQRVAHIDTIIQQQGKRAQLTLGKKGGVGYAYYKAHPAELAVARRQIKQQINDFTPSKCSGIF